MFLIPTLEQRAAAAKPFPPIMEETRDPIPWMNTGIPAVRFYISNEASAELLPKVRAFTRRHAGVVGERYYWPVDDPGVERHMRPGVYAIVRCPGEEFFRGLFTEPAALGGAGGHAGLACEEPVLFAGEIEIDHENNLTAWTSVSGIYQQPAGYCDQSGLTRDLFYRLVPAEELDRSSRSYSLTFLWRMGASSRALRQG